MKKVLDDILALVNSTGLLPWQKTWQGSPANAVTKREYRGYNRLVLGFADYGSPYWLTFKQAKKLGGYIKKGEKHTKVIYCEWITKETVDVDGNRTKDVFPYTSVWQVYNLDQTGGITIPVPKVPQDWERPIAEYPNPPAIKHETTQPHYNPKDDVVNMPHQHIFTKPEEYFSTLYHELVHSTGHKDRLNRLKATSKHTQEYSFEELVAEIGAAFLAAKTNLPLNVNNSAAYIKGWLAQLEANPSWIIKAANQAERAVGYIYKETPYAQPNQTV